MSDLPGIAIVEGRSGVGHQRVRAIGRYGVFQPEAKCD